MRNNLISLLQTSTSHHPVAESFIGFDTAEGSNLQTFIKGGAVEGEREREKKNN